MPLDAYSTTDITSLPSRSHLVYYISTLAMAFAEQQDWPDRTLNILVPTTILCVLSTAVFIWRLVYGIEAKRKLVLCDYLLIIATVRHLQQLFYRR